MKCVICKTGDIHPGFTTVALQREKTVVVFHDVPADICENCGEYYLDAVTANRVYVAAKQSFNRHVEVEILNYAA